jgi:hypothetical protein
MAEKDLPVIDMVPGTWKSENGVVLKLKKVSRFVIVDMGRKIPVPKIPVVYIEDKGRNEENPNDPDYIEALNEANYKRAMATVTASLTLGTEIVSLPEGMPGPDDDEWFSVLEALDIDVPKDNKRLRYSAWLKYIALDDNSFNDLIQLVFKFSGLTTEQEVAAAQNGFRGETTWAADIPVSDPAESPSGNNNSGQ